ncbi:asparagine synthase [Sphaerospermopsis aphanizomenoides BCCUSP55]|uniref:TylF/MycF/NovP-related O-methyltransferase n=1 Tax=Sphaerospermopsis aphanizomenoides TaxID=459663 RepID=UPI001903D568|nr:TylF/MycF/NovP-related O-methyltransferase [Sphaerospermopsis aphanizomenoides]MBK1987101.1 asparagine synthase [Sphaerospermopsis aphanizomenoides BCCUSP55]
MLKLFKQKSKALLKKFVHEPLDIRLSKIASNVLSQHLTYLSRGALIDIMNATIEYDNNKVSGIIIETGCALGGSAIAIASVKSQNREVYVYDVFGMIPPPSEKDDLDVHQRYNIIASGNSQGIGNKTYYGYEENLYDKVIQNFQNFDVDVSQNNVYLVKGLFEDTLIIDKPVVLAHIDCDWYDSVYTCLQRIEPCLVTGGTFVIDDYNDWSGARKAVDDFFQDKKNNYDFLMKERLHIIKR